LLTGLSPRFVRHRRRFGFVPRKLFSGFGGMYAETDESRRLSYFSRFDDRMTACSQSVQSSKKWLCHFFDI
jgi:hypothetical protein